MVFSVAGVGAGGLLELRAQVYRTQEHARMVREGDAERPVRRKVCRLGRSAPMLTLTLHLLVTVRT